MPHIDQNEFLKNAMLTVKSIIIALYSFIKKEKM